MGVKHMRTVSLFKNGRNKAVRLPKEFEFEGVSELEISREGDTLILRPARKSWTSFATVDKAYADFLLERPEVIGDGRVVL